MSEFALFGKNLFGDEIRPKPTGPLAERFIFPPFSVLDARQGEWQRRKRAWIATGIQSELGRNSEVFAIGDKSEWEKQNKKIEPWGGGGPNSCYRRKKIHPGGDNDALQIMGSSKKYGVNAHLSEKSQKALGCYGAYGSTVTDRGQGSATGTSIFDPTLCELIYRWFCPPGGQVIDPFAGGSVRGIVAALMGLNYWGSDLRPEQIEANRQQADAICGDIMPKWVCGDSIDTLENAPMADLIFSCPPYGDLEIYSDDPRDLSTMEYHTFIAALKRIALRAINKLNPSGMVCFVVGDFRDKRTGNYRGFVAHTIHIFQELGLHLFNEAILVTSCGSLPIRVSNQFDKNRKLGKTHQNVLIFRR